MVNGSICSLISFLDVRYSVRGQRPCSGRLPIKAYRGYQTFFGMSNVYVYMEVSSGIGGRGERGKGGDGGNTSES